MAKKKLVKAAKTKANKAKGKGKTTPTKKGKKPVSKAKKSKKPVKPRVNTFARWNSIMTWLYKENDRLGGPHTRYELWKWGKILSKTLQGEPYYQLKNSSPIPDDLLEQYGPEILAENNIEFYPNPLQIDTILREGIEHFHIFLVFEDKRFPKGVDVVVNGINDAKSAFNSTDYKYQEHMRDLMREYNGLKGKASGDYLFYGFILLKPGENPMLKKSYYIEYFLKFNDQWIHDLPPGLHFQDKAPGEIADKFKPTPEDIKERKEREKIEEPIKEEPIPEPKEKETITDIDKQIEIEREKSKQEEAKAKAKQAEALIRAMDMLDSGKITQAQFDLIISKIS